MGWETTPLLFAGQYEDTETGLVYNRYRYYNPHTATYAAQDPLGVGPNPATTQGYVHNPTTWTDNLGLQAHRKVPDGCAIQTAPEQPFRGGSYQEMSTVGPNATETSYVPYERHHIASRDALQRTKKNHQDAPAIQMEIPDHQTTSSWGSAPNAIATRNREVSMTEQGRMDDVMVDELAHLESQYSGRYADASYEALDYYLASGWREANMLGVKDGL